MQNVRLSKVNFSFLCAEVDLTSKSVDMGNFGGCQSQFSDIPPVELGAESEVIGLPSITVYNRVVKRVARRPHCGPPCCLEWPSFEI